MKRETRKKSTKKMGLSASDYRKILKFYKLSIPKKVSNLRKKGDKIIAKKFCSCIKKVRKKFKKEGIAIGICTKSVITRKGIKRGSFNCKSKTSIDLYKGGSKRSTKKNRRKKRGAGGVFSCKRCGNKKDKKEEEREYYTYNGKKIYFDDSDDDDLPEWFEDASSILPPMEHYQTLSLVHGNDKRPISPFLSTGEQEDTRISPLLSLDDKGEGFGQFVNIEKWKGGRKKTRKRRGGMTDEEKREERRKRIQKAINNLGIATAKLKDYPVYHEKMEGFEIPPEITGERGPGFVGTSSIDFDKLSIADPISKKEKKSTKKGGRKRSTKKNRRTRKKRGRGYEDDVRAALSKDVITGKKCLDIGTRDGLNCLTLVEKGAKSVLGIDLDESKFKEHQEVNNEKKITLRQQDFLKMEAKNEEEKFDVITCFLWNFGFPQLKDFALKVKSLLRKEGVFILGLYDNIYINGDEYTDSVPKRLEEYFNSSIRVWSPAPKWKHQYIWEMKV